MQLILITYAVLIALNALGFACLPWAWLLAPLVVLLLTFIAAVIFLGTYAIIKVGLRNG